MTANKMLTTLRDEIRQQNAFVQLGSLTLASDGERYTIRDASDKILFENHLFLVALAQLITKHHE